MTQARIQPCLIKLGVNLGYYNGKEIRPQNIMGKTALKLHNNQFCSFWKSEGVSFNEAIKELNDNFKVVDNYITDENNKSCFEYIDQPKKIESHLTKFFVYDLETHNTDRRRPYVFCFYRLSKLSGRYKRDLTYEIVKCKKETTVFDGDNCVCNALDICLKIQGEKEKLPVIKKLLNITYNYTLIMVAVLIHG